MNESDIILIKRSWRVFRQMDPAVVGDVFYSKLFSYNRSLRNMFPSNMNQQYQKLMTMINTIISRLDKLNEINAEITSMAQRHLQYGVRPGHYKLVGNALLWTLKQGLGDDWTPEVEKAWTQCYSQLSKVMIKAAEKKLIY